jgi:DNA modification methylase
MKFFLRQVWESPSEPVNEQFLAELRELKRLHQPLLRRHLPKGFDVLFVIWTGFRVHCFFTSAFGFIIQSTLTKTAKCAIIDAMNNTETHTSLESCYQLIHADCFRWVAAQPDNSIHAVVTDPPYGLKEYTDTEKRKLRQGRGGVWRIPPTFDGCTRRPLPRFTVLSESEKLALSNFFSHWASLLFRVLVPGGHVFIATNPLVSHLVYLPLIGAGFEKRGEIIRLVQTLRGGDRPKNAHKEFDGVTVMPRSGWEPWGLFRKPLQGRVQDNLRKWKTGGLRRISESQPFCDVIPSAPTRNTERDIAPHPSLKPQAFMRQIVRAALPLGEGVILDPFMGGGSTIAAASAVGYRSIGVESDAEFYAMAVQAIPRLAELVIENGTVSKPTTDDEMQQTLF